MNLELTIEMLRRWDGQISGRSIVSLFHEARDWHWAGWMQEINTHYADRCGGALAAPKGVLPA